MISTSNPVDKKHNKITTGTTSQVTAPTASSLDNIFLNKSVHSFGHDVRSPLFVIRSYAYLLQKTQEKEKLSRGFEMIESATYKIEKLLNGYIRLIDIYTLPQPEYTKVSFLDAYQKALQLIALLTEQKKVVLRQNFAGATQVFFSEAQLIDVMIALIDNAIRHNPDKADLVISIKTSKKNGNICLEVSDNGIGFSSETERNKMVAPFSSLSNDNTCLGLGLSLVNAIAQTSKNNFKIKSNDKSTTCCFTFLA